MITINIFEKSDLVVHLQKGVYDIYVSGGYYIFLNGFKVSLSSIGTSEIILLNPTLKIRSRINGAKTVRFFRMEIVKSDNYLVKIWNPQELVIKKSMLILRRLIES